MNINEYYTGNMFSFRELFNMHPLTQETLAVWFPNMPMLPERVRRLREVGQVLLEGKYIVHHRIC